MIVEIPVQINQLNHLKEFSLTHSMVKNVPKELFDLDHLEELDLSDNEIEKISEDIAKLINLRVLRVGRAWYKQLENSKGNILQNLPKELFSLQKLEVLDISQNKLVEISNDIQNLKSLNSLILSDNRIEKLPDVLPDMKLRTLRVEGNRLKKLPEGIEKLGIIHFNIERNPDIFLTDEQKLWIHEIDEHEKRMSEIF